MQFGKHTGTRHQHGEVTQYTFKFANGWKASVVRGDISYGAKQGLWEFAPVDPQGQVPASQVKGWLTPDEVGAKLDELERRES